MAGWPPAAATPESKRPPGRVKDREKGDIMTSSIIRESSVRKGRYTITSLEFVTGEFVLYIFDKRTGIQEDIELREYINAYEVYHDFDQGWMANGQEIPYLGCF